VLKRPGPETTRFQLLIPKSRESRVAHWLRALSDGYVHMDPDDVFAKAPGPVVVRRLPHELADEWAARPPAAERFEEEAEVEQGEGWAFHKPYWIGQRARADAPGGLEPLPEFEWQEPTDRPLRRTTLFDAHNQAGAKMAPFAGWEMPIRYTSVHEEHLAVRQAAGLFDVSHMGLFEFSGENVHLFVNTLTTNDVSLLGVGQSHYSFLLDPQGHVLDDVWVYRLGEDHYWMVVVRGAEVMIDPQRPWSRALGTETVVVRDLHDPSHGSEMRVQLALQGPRSRDVLLALLEEDDPFREPLLEMKRNEIIHGNLAGYDSRTGYTGEPMAFEIFVHPAAATALWHALLEVGEPLGLRPVGLAARDSLRIEAGLPLYGHELAGPLDLNPADAGFAPYVKLYKPFFVGNFAPYVKLYKPFFVGKAAYVAHERQRQARLIRFRFVEEHARLPNAVAKRGTRLAVFQVDSRSWSSKPLAELKAGDRIQLHDDVVVIPRFLNKQE